MNLSSILLGNGQSNFHSKRSNAERSSIFQPDVISYVTEIFAILIGSYLIFKEILYIIFLIISKKTWRGKFFVSPLHPSHPVCFPFVEGNSPRKSQYFQTSEKKTRTKNKIQQLYIYINNRNNQEEKTPMHPNKQDKLLKQKIQCSVEEMLGRTHPNDPTQRNAQRHLQRFKAYLLDFQPIWSIM